MAFVPVTEPSELIIMLPVGCDLTGEFMMANDEMMIRIKASLNRLSTIDTPSFWCY